MMKYQKEKESEKSKKWNKKKMQFALIAMYVRHDT